MSIQETIEDGWARHEKEPAAVLDAVRDQILNVADAADLVPLGRLLFHVGAEHLGRFTDVQVALGRLRARPCCRAGGAEERALWRFTAAAHLCAGEASCAADAEAKAIGDSSLPKDSERGAVRALAASTLLGQRRTSEAAALFEEALACAAYGPGKDDPLARALAVTGNNLACELEGRKDRGAAEDRLLLTAAQTGRRFWEIAGTWSHVQSAEYRLALTHCALGDGKAALVHATNCAELCRRHEAGPGDQFFAHEALARAHHACGDPHAAHAARAAAAAAQVEIADEGMRAYCAGELAKLEKHLAAAP